jgi:hypothetical protein
MAGWTDRPKKALRSRRQSEDDDERAVELIAHRRSLRARTRKDRPSGRQSAADVDLISPLPPKVVNFERTT